ncbi:MAG TPA: hypothetical protein VJO35_04310 [Terriglobales bacterium]|nr:hypothetical protein [Terriglobales bacterium]
MKRALVVIVLLHSLTVLSVAHTHRNSKPAFDSCYNGALATANRFLQAWQAEDHETGIVMLTDAARSHSSADVLQSFFSPGSDAAYEIARGKRVNAATYVFPIVLFSSGSTPSHRHASKIVIVRNGIKDWAVNKLP